MADLTKSLSQIVGSLTDLLSKMNKTNLQPESSRIFKTNDMTYHDFLGKVLAGKEPLQVHNRNSPYAVQEDLQLLFELASSENINIKTFQGITNGKKILRSPESLQKRYYETLYKVEEKDMKKIVNWVEVEGAVGFLGYIGDELLIQRHQPIESTNKRKRTVSLDKEAKLEEGSRRAIRGLKIPNNCKELHQTMKVYSKMVDIPEKTLLTKLDLVSGDLIELDKYVETKDARLLWTPAQDQILRNKGPELEILKRYRRSTMEARKKYLGIN